jgi:LPXTG-motif cell wall-anchored protein
MDTTTLVLLGLAAVFLVLYLGRRRSRLSREEE